MTTTVTVNSTTKAGTATPTVMGITSTPTRQTTTTTKKTYLTYPMAGNIVWWELSWWLGPI